MTKYLFIFLASAIVYGWFVTAQLWLPERDKRVTAEKELNICNKSIKEYQDGQTKTNQTIYKLRKASQSCKTNCDCYNQPIPDDLLDILRKRHQERKNRN